MRQTYEEFIQNILDTRGRSGCGDEYHEVHHIKPKCMGGTNENDNLIDLFAREHFIAHKLLAEENPDNYSLIYAWTCMAFMKNNYQERYEITPDEYEELKLAMSNTKKKLYSDPENNPMYGKQHSEETRKKWSELRKGKQIGENNPMYGIRKFGKDNPNYGKHHTEETRDKISNARTGKKASESTKKKQSAAIKESWTDEKRQMYSETRMGSNNQNAKTFIRLSDNKIYKCGIDAAEDNHISYSTLMRMCKRRDNFMRYDEWLIIQNDYKNTED